MVVKLGLLGLSALMSDCCVYCVVYGGEVRTPMSYYFDVSLLCMLCGMHGQGEDTLCHTDVSIVHVVLCV